MSTNKVSKAKFEAEMDMKAEKGAVDRKLDRLEFENATGDLQQVIDDMLNKLLALVQIVVFLSS